MPRAKTKTISQLKNLADARFSRFIRIRDSNKDGIITCITCKTKIPRKKAHNCHWIGRSNMKYRRNERNCNAGCASCNTYRAEMHMKVYTLVMIDRYGRKWVDDALAERYKVHPIKRYQIEEVIERYKPLVMQSTLYHK